MKHPGGAKLYAMAVWSVQEASNDPEDTLQVAMTMQKLALFSLGLSLVFRLFPEIGNLAADAARDLRELTQAQAFLDSEEWEYGG